MKAVVAAFNQERALVGVFSVITNLRMELFQALQIMITKRGKCRKMIIKFADTKYQAAAHRSVYYLVNNLYIIYIIYMPCEEEQDMYSRVSFSTNIFFPMIIIIMIMYSDGTWYQSIQDPIVIFHRTRYQPSLLIPNLKEYLTKTIFLT